MPHKEHKCACGKEFTAFRYFKDHILNQKCRSNTGEIPVTPVNSVPNTPTSSLQNPNMNQPNIQHRDPETTQVNNATEAHKNVAYKSTHPNQNPKSPCIFCNKLYSKHNLQVHKSKCKHKYKDCWQYKLLIRAGITNIPETYIEVVELFNKLNEENPQLFTNLPPVLTQVDDITSELPRNGRPRKQRQQQQPQTVIEQHIGQNIGQQHIGQQIEQQINTTNNNNTTNNITNNNQQNINIFLNPVCNESIDHISEEKQIFIILQRLHAYKAYIDCLYEKPANHNICYSDRKCKKVKYLDKQHGINDGSAQNVIGDIAMAHLGQIDSFIEKHKKNIPAHRKPDLNFLESLLLNEHNNKVVIGQLSDKVAMLSSSSKILLDKYQKQRAIDYINSLPEPDDA